MKICVITATRAEYGLLKPLLQLIKDHNSLELQILVTGAHLSPEFGLTYRQIIEDGFNINAKVEMLVSSDTPNGIVKSMGLGLLGYADAFQNLKPNAIVILGDRYEMLSVASASTIFNIPIIHLHGGEITEGAYDDAIRHAISKLSYLHFTSTDSYRKRVIQLGEDPNLVYNVGAIGLDNIKDMHLLNKEELENILEIKFKKFNYQVTFHPETLSKITSKEQFEILLKAIKIQKDSFFIFTKANADTDGRVINQLIDEFCSENPLIAKSFTSLGSLKFLSVLKICSAIVGNSSSGIIEAPSLGTWTINIGGRQKGRIQADSVINCDVSINAITRAFDEVKNSIVEKSNADVINPYGDGGTAAKIIEIIEKIDFTKIGVKTFYDI